MDESDGGDEIALQWTKGGRMRAFVIIKDGG